MFADHLSVVIPSRTPSNLKRCIAAVWRHEPDLVDRIIWVDDCEDEPETGLGGALMRVRGEKPFIFARTVNLGIQASKRRRGVIVLNDDALLKTDGGFTALQKAAKENESLGVIGAVTNITGQPLQQPQSVGLRIVPHLAFVCVLIPRRTINLVGLLDERYCLDYGVEDRDYCEACRRKGLSSAVLDDCYVDHGSLTSTYRGDPRTSRDFSQNKGLFEQKWGAGTWEATA